MTGEARSAVVGGTEALPSDRDRLLLALAELAAYGIAAEESLLGTPDQAREDLLVRLWTRAPRALGSYAFWTRSAESSFDPTGTLRTPLPLHTSDDVAEPAEFVLHRAGFTVHRTAHRLEVTHP
ncbi:hypothetical protein [Pseudonocardia pini]|uniref:hypothetical protein n=1 Tax=Pseudonocardia pini TaxID=2758030 RepID=UPI0015F0C159|nr:hypothetical protein [Pseudonocardia pini]